MELQVCDVTKRFGEKTALDGVSFTALPGQPLGLLGRNGAGKTTIMRIIMNIFLPDSGVVLLDGQPVSRYAHRLGYLPEERGLYARTPIDEQLIYIARLRGMGREDSKQACTYWLERLDMLQYRRARPQTLSKGNQQRIQLALALINDPDVVILDEPFSGLDPVNSMQLRTIAAELAERGKTVIFSSHQMSMVENFCDHVVLLNSGQAVLDTSLSQLRAQSPGSSVFIRTGDNDTAARLAGQYGKVTPERGGLTAELEDSSQQNSLLRTLLDASLDIFCFEHIAPSLEDIFLTFCNDSPPPASDAGGDR